MEGGIEHTEGLVYIVLEEEAIWPSRNVLNGRDPPFPMAYSCRSMHPTL
jgi:hypothetical protein